MPPATNIKHVSPSRPGVFEPATVTAYKVKQDAVLLAAVALLAGNAPPAGPYHSALTDHDIQDRLDLSPQPFRWSALAENLGLDEAELYRNPFLRRRVLLHAMDEVIADISTDQRTTGTRSALYRHELHQAQRRTLTALFEMWRRETRAEVQA